MVQLKKLHLASLLYWECFCNQSAVFLKIKIYHKLFSQFRHIDLIDFIFLRLLRPLSTFFLFSFTCYKQIKGKNQLIFFHEDKRLEASEKFIKQLQFCSSLYDIFFSCVFFNCFNNEIFFKLALATFERYLWAHQCLEYFNMTTGNISYGVLPHFFQN